MHRRAREASATTPNGDRTLGLRSNYERSAACPYERGGSGIESPRSAETSRRHDRHGGVAHRRRPDIDRPRANGAGSVRCRPRSRFLGLDPRRAGGPKPLRRRPRADRGSGRRDVGGPPRRRHDRVDHPVRREGRRLPRLRRSEAPRQPGGRRPVRRLFEIGRKGVSERARSRAHPEDRDRHELRRCDEPSGEAPSAGRGPSRADPVHRRQP